MINYLKHAIIKKIKTIRQYDYLYFVKTKMETKNTLHKVLTLKDHKYNCVKYK